ncbi:MAG: methylenetetrahydrofolate--tRNA-(uracil(54)-C(5))-methyltransferase (FADH(2)-oxidizing) TrmFO [Clostridia bacterium]|nr:methylenetetrahydrofolate--tRNA-(uracil(54)-C(5))-methyltransferase (FADH(2)-oxidizing) TrmFO [Clostridia bacterium]
MKLNIIGAGLAGCEAAWQAAERGVSVRLIEMKPEKYSPAHKYKGMAELVCSNSLRADIVTNAIGLLKEELRRMNSLIMEAAEATKVAAGGALAVDRYKFSDYITEKILSHPNIEVVNSEADGIDPDAVTVVATGPLTSDKMSEFIEQKLGCGKLHFFDAAAPIVSADSINMDIAFMASRYGKGGSDYINCPMTKEQYTEFYNALITAREAELHDFDKESQKDIKVFEGCMPVEVMARRGFETLCFGPLKPVGLPDPKTGKEAYAVVQLRRENDEGTLYNLVGFQTHLAFPEQKRVFSMIPGLESAEFVRYGVMHRNTYINSPGLLSPDYSLISSPNVFFAGQMTGVEGYIESAASGFVAGINAARRVLGDDPFIFPRETEIGAMAAYVSNGGTGDFQPMNANFGIIAPLTEKVKGGKKARYEKYAQRSLEMIDNIKNDI